MSNYEFWDELGKIFNAVTAYQEKTIEFNKRFINPWIRLGNVFDKQDRNKEAVSAYEQAIELDPNNPQNWYELGNLHFKMESYEEAIDAYNRAIELDPGFGWPYSNLALTLVTQGKHVQAIPLLRKSIELLEQDKDKAVAWNRLGNVYRKLNEYDLAVEAFQRADDLDQDNGGFRDNLDEVSEGSNAVPSSDAEGADQAATLIVSPIELILADQNKAATGTENVETPVSAVDASTQAPIQPNPVAAGETSQPNVLQAVEGAPEEDAPLPEAAAGEGVAAPHEDPTMAAVVEAAQTSQALGEAADSAAHMEETISVVVQGTIETFTDTLTLADTSNETTEATPTTTAADESAKNPVLQDGEALVGNVVSTSDTESTNPTEAALEETSAAEASAAGAEAEGPSVEDVIRAAEKIVAAAAQEGAKIAEIPEQDAYEQFLKDSQQPGGVLEVETVEDAAESNNATASQEPIAKIDAAGELELELDTKNAHVWNELGNVYFNTSAYDDAIAAYSKAIELDRWFAWPYSNLALAYVQKGRFAEAILLYQRSIELFTSEKDKAISWNRLGNVYRRLNDYENAIASYQRADDLDPDNTTLSLQSRFSLLGSYTMEQKPSYVS